MFDWNDLKHFLAVARHGSTIAAAKALGVNQSTVQRRLDELEERLGRQLVARNQAGYKLTELGKDMVAHAARVEDAAVAFERRLAASDLGLKGTLRVTCPEALGVRLMRSPIVGTFHQRYPGLRVQFMLSDKLINLARGEADIAIRGTAPDDNALFGRKIADAPWAIYASRSYIKRHGSIKNIEDINRHSVALFDIELRAHLTKKWLETAAPKARIAARCNSVSGLIESCKSGVGLAALPMVVGDREKHLVRVLGPIAGLTTPFYLLMHRDMRSTPRVRVFFDFVIENLPMIRSLFTGELRRDDAKSGPSKPKR
jgi:DNA-binding transcriptional LysR family regulator